MKPPKPIDPKERAIFILAAMLLFMGVETGGGTIGQITASVLNSVTSIANPSDTPEPQPVDHTSTPARQTVTPQTVQIGDDGTVFVTQTKQIDAYNHTYNNGLHSLQQTES